MNDSEIDPIQNFKEIEIPEINRKQESQQVETNQQLASYSLWYYQLRGIFLKNLVFQSKQVAMNVFILLSPLVVIGLIWVARYEVETTMTNDIDLSQVTGIPFFQNLPTGFFSQSSAYPVTASNCLRWFLVKDSSGSGENISELLRPLFYDYCSKAKSAVPFTNKTDQELNKYLFGKMQELDKSPIVFGEEIEGADILPDAAVEISKFSRDQLSLDMHINDLILGEYHRDNGLTKLSFKTPSDGPSIFSLGKNLTSFIQRPEYETREYFTSPNKFNFKKIFSNNKVTFPIVVATDGILSVLDLITKNLLRLWNNKVKILTSFSYLDVFSIKNILFSAGFCLLTVVIIPLANSTYFPALLYFLVVEKEEKTTQMMKIHGMNIIFYFIINYISYIIATMISSISFILGCYYILELPLFTNTHWSIVLGIYFLWCHSQIALAFLMQNFSISTKMTLNVSFMISIFTIGGGVMLNSAVFIDPLKLPLAFHLLPQLVFTRLLKILAVACTNDRCVGSPSLMSAETVQLFWSFFIFPTAYLILGIYLAQRNVTWSLMGRHHSKPVHIHHNEQVHQKVQNILNSHKLNEHSLIVSGLEKTYHTRGSKPVEALRGVDILIEKGEMFGLLGPNGAGKTTLISVLTGLLQADSGQAFIEGLDVFSQMGQIYSLIGVCPQFDCLWPDLSAEDHFLFYIRMRGIAPTLEKLLLEETLQHMKLTEHRYKAVRELSGGMKRRVSIGIALTGRTKLLFLDEPTSGLDPINRMQIWQILKETKGKKAILMTTHLMDEADQLCNRVAIIDHGEVVCCDFPSTLKRKYCSGFTLNLNVTAAVAKEAIFEFVREFDSQATARIQDGQFWSLNLAISDEKIIEFFDRMNASKSSLGIASWSLSQNSLKEVFMNAVRRKPVEAQRIQ